MRKFSMTAMLLMCSFATGCAYPKSSVEQGIEASTLYFSADFGAAHVFVDGTDMGLASGFDGRKASLPVVPGRHRVVVRGDGAPLYDRPIYVGASTRIEIKGF